MQEGDRVELVYPNGEVQEIELKQASVEHTIETDDLEKGNLKPVSEAIESMTTDMANHIERGLLDTMMASPPELFGQFEASTPEELAESLLSKMKDLIVEFDEHGNPTTGIVAHPNSIGILAAMQDLPGVPEKWAQMIRRKHREWSARERSRKLVD